MRAILINPYDRTITEQTDDSKWSLDVMYRILQVQTVVPLRITPRDILWGDDNGFVVAGHPVFRTKWYPGPLCGRCLILGVRGSHHAPAVMTLAEAQASVEWTDLESSGNFRKPETRTDVPGFDFMITMGAPVLRPRISETHSQ